MANRPVGSSVWTRTAAVVLACVGAIAARAQEPAVVGSPTLLTLDGPSEAYPNGTFGEQLAAAAQGEGGPVGGPRYRPGPGRRDDWKVGPHWRVTADGVVLYRDDADMTAILAQVQPIAPQSALPPLEFLSNFDHAAGARVLLTSEFPQCQGYELQVGYLGVEKWLANAYFEQETIPAASLPLSDADVMQRRQLTYDSRLHSFEVNFQRATRGYLKPFAGVRYFLLDESIYDQNRQFTNVILGDPVNVGDTLSSATTQSLRGVEVENNLIGFQTGLRLDMWRPTRRLHLNGFVSAGVYCDILGRDRVYQENTSITTSERVTVPGTGGAPDTTAVETTTNALSVTEVTKGDGARVAFVGEASLAATWRLNNALALRGGYQVLVMEGIELAEGLWTAPPPITPVADSLLLHGWFAGLEYRR